MIVNASSNDEIHLTALFILNFYVIIKKNERFYLFNESKPWNHQLHKLYFLNKNSMVENTNFSTEANILITMILQI